MRCANICAAGSRRDRTRSAAVSAITGRRVATVDFSRRFAAGSAYPAFVRRDRHGRGPRGPLAPRGVPISASPADRFDRIASEAIEHVEHRWRTELANVEFAVDLVPALEIDSDPSAEGAIESGGVLLAAIVPARGTEKAHIVLYRKPIELRARDLEDLEDLVHDIVVHVISNYLGLEPEVVDPGFGGPDPSAD